MVIPVRHDNIADRVEGHAERAVEQSIRTSTISKHHRAVVIKPGMLFSRERGDHAAGRHFAYKLVYLIRDNHVVVRIDGHGCREGK
jgi:hypothetical protein